MGNVRCENALLMDKAQVFVVNANKHHIRASTGDLFVLLIPKCMNEID
jgi:hypothetical protein